jgi:hypothetical protein
VIPVSVLVLVVLALAGCAGQGAPAGTAPPAAAQGCAYAAGSPAAGLITVQASGTDCGSLLQFLASAGETWAPVSDPAAPDEWGTAAQAVCSLASGGAAVTVRVAGGDELDAETICSALEQQGWSPA